MPYILVDPLYYNLEICFGELFQFYAYLHRESLTIYHRYDYTAFEDIFNEGNRQD